MTDLERLWDDLPAGRPPTGDILREGRRATGSASSRRRHLLVRPLLTAAIATGVVGAFVAGVLVADDGSGTRDADIAGPGGGRSLPSHASFQADLPAAEDCDQLLTAYRDRGLARVTAWGWDSQHRYGWRHRGPILLQDGTLLDAPLPSGVRDLSGATNRVSQGFSAADRSTADLSLSKGIRQESSETGTNVQEIGVDEPDLVKTDGERLVRLRDDELITYDVTDDEPRQLSSVDLPGLEHGEIMLAGDTVVAVGVDEQAQRLRTPYGPGERRGTRVVTVDLADPEAPEITESVTYDARLLSARQHGDAVRLVMSSGLPDLPFVQPGRDRGRRAALRHNAEVVEESTIEDWLPTITAAEESEQLLDCTDVAIPSDELALDTVSVVGFDAAAPVEVDAIGLAGATDIAYESVDHLYLAASPSRGTPECFDCLGARWAPSVRGGTTYLFDFRLEGTAATHVASGEVEGAVADRWAMDEARGVLRVAVGPTSETGDFNSIVTLQRRGQDLVERGRLDDLGPDEDIQSVRWADDVAFVVTFRRVDPLFAIDLSDDADPSLIGELKIPGFSSYLHPLGSRRLVGVGEGPGPEGRWGAQAGLFDIRDLAQVRRVALQHYGPGTQALAGTDPRSFTWLPQHRTVLTVVADRDRARVGYVSTLRVEDGNLENRMTQVEYGDDVDDVRTVPLPDGRVVLVTGEDVEFFALPTIPD